MATSTERQLFVMPPPGPVAGAPVVPLNEVWLYDGGAAYAWQSTPYKINLSDSDPGYQVSFAGTWIQDKSDFVAYNLPVGRVLTLFNNTSTPPKTEPYNFAGLGVCVDLFGTRKTETVDLAKVGAVNCLTSYIWRDPDFNTGLFQLFDTGSKDEPTTATEGPRTTIFLSEWAKDQPHSLAKWAICDASDSIYYSGLNAQSVFLYDGGNGDGAATAPFSGWQRTTWALLRDEGFTNRAGSWSWMLLRPVYSVVDDVKIGLSDAAASTSSYTQEDKGTNRGDSTYTTGASFTNEATQSITTQVSKSVTTGSSLTASLTSEYKAGVPGEEVTESWSIGITFSESETVSNSTDTTVTSTQTITQIFSVVVPPNHTWNVTWVVQTGKIPAVSYSTPGHYYYDKPVPGSYPDPDMAAKLGMTAVYCLSATITGILKGSLAAGSTADIRTVPISGVSLAVE